MSRNYTTRIRLLLCQHCGAPLEAAPTGGTVACGYCRAQNQVGRRVDDRAIAPPGRAPVDEATRLGRLRMQDGRPLEAPPSLVPLMNPGTGDFHPAKVEEAFHVYQATRNEVEKTGSPEAMERLYFLTLVANTHLTRTGDHPRRRALLETSLETLRFPRHRQVLRALLANAAAKEGDLESAERWLAPCDPRSEDLEADSAFRLAHAYLASHRGAFDRVLALLGAQDGAYPFHDAFDPLAAVLRANALERLGHLDAAIAALRARMAAEGVQGRRTMAQIRAQHPALELCARSFPHAERAHAAQASRAAARGVAGGAGTILLVAGGAVILAGFGITALTTIPVALATGQDLGAMLVGGGFTSFVGCVTTLPVGLILGGLGWALRRKAQKAAWLRLHGVEATGTIRGYEDTGMKINGVPRVRVQVEVHHPHHAPYVASFEQLLRADVAPLLQPGVTVGLRVHPQNPHELVAELG
jgi:hypothetical protein